MIKEDERRKIATEVAMGFRGLPYLWGGDDPVAAFDCSRMCIEVLKSVDMVGNDLGFGLGTCGKDGQGVPVGDAQPTLRIPEIVVGGRDVEGKA